jgi:hypothetical protein
MLQFLCKLIFVILAVRIHCRSDEYCRRSQDSFHPHSGFSSSRVRPHGRLFACVDPSTELFDSGSMNGATHISPPFLSFIFCSANNPCCLNFIPSRFRAWNPVFTTLQWPCPLIPSVTRQVCYPASRDCSSNSELDPAKRQGSTCVIHLFRRPGSLHVVLVKTALLCD